MKNITRAFILMLVLVLTLVFGVGSVALAANAYTDGPLTLLGTYATDAKVTLINPNTGEEYVYGENGYTFSKDDDLLFRIDFKPTGSDYVYADGDAQKDVLYALREAYRQQTNNVVDANGHETRLPSIDENTVFTIPFKTAANMNLENVPTSPDAVGNVAYDKENRPIFKWWFDVANDQVCVQFTEEALAGDFEIVDMYVGVQGTLNFDELDENGRTTFTVAERISFSSWLFSMSLTRTSSWSRTAAACMRRSIPSRWISTAIMATRICIPS